MTTKKKVAESEPKKIEAKKITPVLICEVLRGDWGDEKTRSAKLKAAGYAPSVVTKKINDLKKIYSEIAPQVSKVGDYLICLTFFSLDEK